MPCEGGCLVSPSLIWPNTRAKFLPNGNGHRAFKAGLNDFTLWRLAAKPEGRHIAGMMNVAVEIPDSVSAALQSKWRDVPRRVLEATAAEAYRTRALTAHQVGQLLGHGSRWETEAFLKHVQ